MKILPSKKPVIAACALLTSTLAFVSGTVHAAPIAAQVTYGIASGTFPGSTGTHSHSSTFAEVGRFESSEEVRGGAEFSLATLTAPVTSATLSFARHTVNGCCNQASGAWTVLIESFVADGFGSLSDYSVGTSGTIGTFTTSSVNVGDVLTFDITSLLNSAIDNNNLYFGVRLRNSTSPGVNQAQSYVNFSIDAIPAVTNDVPEPSIFSLFGLGIAGMLINRQRRRSK